VGLFGSRRNQVVRRRGDGRFDLVLDPEVRATVGALLGELDALLTDDPDDPGLRRLNPPAYLEDAEKDAEYQLLAGDELRTSRREAITAVRASLEQDELGEDDLWGWLQALNALRLVVGTRLDITDDDHGEDDVAPDDPTAPLWAIYHFSTWLQHEVIRGLQT
jgi:hypothetical protein